MMMRLSVERAKAVLTYNPSSGVFIRNMRPEGPGWWNTRYAGKPTGTINAGGYLVIGIDDEIHYAHRLAWMLHFGEYPDFDIDHVNGVKADNRILNLRAASMSQNIANAKIRSTNTSGAKGVSYLRRRRRWRARIKLAGREIFLGHFVEKSDAITAYELAASKYFGEFARMK